MKRLYLLVFVALVACQSGSKEAAPAPGGDEAYKADIEALCDVLARTGTEHEDPNDRAMKVATWLGTNLKTQDAKKFLSKIRPIKGAAKGDALEAEAKRVGLPGCALAAVWRAPH